MARDLDEALTDVCQPSELGRREDALAKDGHASDISGIRTAFAAVGLSGSSEAAGTSARDRLLSSFKRGGRYGKFADRIARIFDLEVAEAEKVLAKIEDPNAWQPFFVPGVDVLQVRTGPKYPNAIAIIARIQPGNRFPEHVHRGEEVMFLLDGGLKVEGEEGAEVWRGDELVSVDGSEHAFVALPDQPCIAASLVDGVIELK